MYELTCPSCGHVEPSPFVRAGAVINCLSCRKAFQIEAKDFKRTLAEAPAKADDGLIGEPKAAPYRTNGDGAKGKAGQALIDAAPAQAAGKGESDGKRRSGSSRGRRGTSRRKAEVAPTAAAAPVPVAVEHAPVAGPGQARQVARLMAKRRNQTTLLMVSGAMSLVLIGAAVLIWMAVNNKPDQPNPGPGVVGGTASNDSGGGDSTGPDSTGGDPVHTSDASNPSPVTPKPPIDVGATKVQPQRLEPTQWRRVDEVFDPAANIGVATFTAEQFIPEAAPNDFVRYEATVALALGQSEAAAGAVAHLALVNEHGRVFARAEAPLALLTVDRRQAIQVHIPNELVEEAESMHASVEIRQTLPNPTFFDNIRSQEMAVSGERVLHVSATNGVNNSLRRAVFVIQAMDKQDRVVGRWRVDWQGAVDPLDRLEFDAVLSDVGPLAAAVSRWDVIGAGEQLP